MRRADAGRKGATLWISLLPLALRVVGLALQASLLWSLFGNRDSR